MTASGQLRDRLRADSRGRRHLRSYTMIDWLGEQLARQLAGQPGNEAC